MTKGIDWLMVSEGILAILMFLIWDKSWIITAGIGATIGILFIIDILRNINLRRERKK